MTATVPIGEKSMETATTSSGSAPGWLSALLVFLAAMAVLVPTTTDFGLTYDEPAYNISQDYSVQWWEQLAAVRSASDLTALLSTDNLTYYWPYARFGVNFHPTLSGQLNLLSYQLLHGVISDTAARRMASVIEFALTVTLIFTFVAHRFGKGPGLVAALGLLLLPRLYGQAHLIDTDIPGLLIWMATAFAFWKGLEEPNGRAWRVCVGVLVGLAFIQKMSTMAVVLPLLAWIIIRQPLRTIRAGDVRTALLDGTITLGILAFPLLLAFREMNVMLHFLPEPKSTNLYVHRPKTWMPGAFLTLPLQLWLLRRFLARLVPNSRLWGTERPAIEILAAMLAFPPVIAWLGNPGWWRETIPRLAHYYALNSNRRGALTDIKILYLGQTYDFSLPWHNGWVLLAITVPLGLLAFGLLGTLTSIVGARRAALPAYFVLHLLIHPSLRMLNTPAHDGVRLMMPTMAFLAILAALGMRFLARRVGVWFSPAWFRPSFALIALAVLGTEAVALWRIHPYELSYYNTLVDGPRGAWHRGFELSYWYDAFNPRVLGEINARLPQDAHVTFPNDLSAPMTFQELQALGQLRGDIRFDAPQNDYPYFWLLTHDSKATANTRLLFALTPWYADEPRQLGGARVVTVAEPRAVARALALQLLTAGTEVGTDDPPHAPPWVRAHAPILARFWGDGLFKNRPLSVNRPLLNWAKHDPDGLVAAAQAIVAHRAELTTDRKDAPKPDPKVVFATHPDAIKLYRIISRFDGQDQASFSSDLLKKRPAALLDAVRILTVYYKEVERVLTRYGFTDPATIGGHLDRDLRDEDQIPSSQPDA